MFRLLLEKVKKLVLMRSVLSNINGNPPYNLLLFVVFPVVSLSACFLRPVLVRSSPASSAENSPLLVGHGRHETDAKIKIHSTYLFKETESSSTLTCMNYPAPVETRKPFRQLLQEKHFFLLSLTPCLGYAFLIVSFAGVQNDLFLTHLSL